MVFKLNKSNIKFNKSLAIRVAVIVVAVIGLIVLGSAVGSSWQKQKQIKAVEAAKVAQAEKAEQDKVNTALSNYKLYVEAYEKERVNCEKGASLYANTLTPTQKIAAQRVQAVPTCGAAVPKS